MADETPPSESAKKQLQEFRRYVADVVGELRSQEVRDTYAALTLPELMNQHLVRLVDGDGIRPSRKQRLDTIYKAFKENLKGIMDTSPEAFRRHDPKDDANTAP
jgi:hypothetical protein